MAKSASTPRVQAAGTAPPRGRGLLGAGSAAGNPSPEQPAAPAALLPPAPAARRVLRLKHQVLGRTGQPIGPSR